MFKQTIGEKRAKEIIKQMIAAAKDSGINLPECEKFVKSGEQLDILKAYAEVNPLVNAQGGFRIAYDDSVKLREYIETLLPSIQQFMAIKKYGLIKLTQFHKDFFPNAHKSVTQK
jgi:hypothetical protein